MGGRRILCNVNDPEEMGLWVRVAKASLKSSSYNLTSGPPTPKYYDLDEFVLGRKEDNIYSQGDNAKEIKKAADKFFSKITLLEKEHNIRLDKIAFIDKGGVGPVGMISFLAMAASKAGKAIIIVRPRKRLVSASIKGQIVKGDNVLILSDVATSGTSIYMAAQKIWHLGGKIPCALVWIDRQLGARENLEQYGIKLYSIVDPQILALNSNELKKAIKEDKQEKCYIDFGGNSKTSVYSALMQ